ncbi:MAG: hypothetical protein P0Y60_16735 [Candidatus Microbacterium colombiense]|nr:MAG: hypothetical protein P0Y60_16735 [Microbacterium sp.]
MDIALEEELRSLRARAYGPKADISQDAAALRRLDELETLRRERITAPIAPTADAGELPEDDLWDETDREVRALFAPAPEANPEPGAMHGQVLAAPTDSADAAHPATDRTPRRRRLLWVASLVAAAVGGAGLTAAVGVMLPVSTSSGAPQIATLEANSSITIPQGFFGAAADTQAFEFHGLTLFQNVNNGIFGNGSASSDPTSSCFVVLGSDQVPAPEEFDSSSWGYEGPVYSACSTGVFPAAVSVPFDGDSPEELSAQFPSGRALQFVLDGDRIGVFLDSKPASTPESTPGSESAGE